MGVEEGGGCYILVSYLCGKGTIEHVERMGGRRRDEKSAMRTMTHTEDEGFFPGEGIFFYDCRDEIDDISSFFR